jgi:RimJ/RimL family protein N-acetyltransferase
MKLKGKRITIEDLKLEDVYEMVNWGKHENVLLDDYNFPFRTDSDIKKWYNIKTKPLRNHYYSVRNENGILIGYFGIKDKKYIFRSAYLGIVFDPNFLDMGYGTETFMTFLPYYFGKMKMLTLYLEVAEFNDRAYHLYQKIGFQKIAYYLDVFPEQSLDIRNPYFVEKRDAFVIEDGIIYQQIFRMKLTRHKFFSLFKDGEKDGFYA